MLFKIYLTFLAAITICAAEPVRVDLYYCTLCMGCIEMYPQIRELNSVLGQSIELHTLPFGIAAIEKKNGKITVTCLHGEKECYGNIIHACSIEHFKETQKYVDFNACLIKERSDDAAIDHCGKVARINAEPIKKCAKSHHVLMLTVKYGLMTRRDMNGDLLPYVPYIRINRKEMKPSNKSVLHEVCAAFKNPPPACNNVTIYEVKLV